MLGSRSLSLGATTGHAHSLGDLRRQGLHGRWYSYTSPEPVARNEAPGPLYLEHRPRHLLDGQHWSAADSVDTDRSFLQPLRLLVAAIRITAVVTPRYAQCPLRPIC